MEQLTREQQQRNVETVNNRRVIRGEESKLMAISPMKHAFCRHFWKRMLDNTWFATEIDVTKDIDCYRNVLTEGERRAYDYALAFVSNLDGIQLHNIVDNIASHVTSPEVRMVLTRQAYEEALHVDAYSTMVEAISQDPMALYTLFERDGVLAAKNAHILSQSASMGEHLDENGQIKPKEFALACVSNVALEGIYFYSAFLIFYTLGKRGRMMASADQIKFINRDELTHLSFFTRLLEEVIAENPGIDDEDFWERAAQIIRSACELEINWGKYLIKGGMIGLSDSIMEDYVKFLGNVRWSTIGGKGELYPGVRNPVQWVEGFASINGEEANFFESKVKAYQVGGTLDFAAEGEDEI